MLNLIYRLAVPSARACSRRALLSATAFISLAAVAQTAERDPLNAPTAGPPVSYQSAFSDYKPYQDPEWMPWKTANDVVREFGGMAGMGGMDDVKDTSSPGTKAGGGEMGNQPAAPAHDMRNMKPETPASAPKKPASPGSKPAEMKTMPGHDMSKMQSSKPRVDTPKAAPAPGMKDKGGMTNMPGHDMGSMQQKTPAAAQTKRSPPPGKPVAPATMPGMSH